MLPPGRNGTSHRARSGQQQLAQGGAVGDSEGATLRGPAQVVTAGLLTLLIVWTLLGNMLVCAAVVRSRHLRAKMTNVFIVSLAVSDLFVENPGSRLWTHRGCLLTSSSPVPTETGIQGVQ